MINLQDGLDWNGMMIRFVIPFPMIGICWVVDHPVMKQIEFK